MMATELCDSDLQDLVRQFEDCTLAKDRWTHRAHLCVAVWYLTQLPRDDATDRIRQGIQRYNASLGNSQGYHETVTLSWIALLADFLSQTDTAFSPAHCATAATERFADSSWLLRH